MNSRRVRNRRCWAIISSPSAPTQIWVPHVLHPLIQDPRSPIGGSSSNLAGPSRPLSLRHLTQQGLHRLSEVPALLWLACSSNTPGWSSHPIHRRRPTQKNGPLAQGEHASHRAVSSSRHTLQHNEFDGLAATTKGHARYSLAMNSKVNAVPTAKCHKQ
jgi:hypothetical protein